MQTTIKTVVDGKELELESLGKYGVERGTHVLLESGAIVERQTAVCHLWLRYFREVKPQYTFGVLTLEETGERRHLVYGEFFLGSGNSPQSCNLANTLAVYRVLKIVKADI